MANSEHIAILMQGVTVWNRWRDRNPDLKPDLSSCNLSRKDFSNANFSGVNFQESSFLLTHFENANLSKIHAFRANFSLAVFENANLDEAAAIQAIFIDTDFTGASLEKTNLAHSNLTWAKFKGARIIATNFIGSLLVEADFSDAVLADCNVYGCAAWGVNLAGIKKQSNLRITHLQQPAIYVDHLEVAQFVYLLLNNEKIRDVIDTVGKKGVLILGRFQEERKAILDALRDKLQELGFVPMMFDFEKPTQRDFTETIKTLAGLSLFIIADITKPRSSPLELQATMPDYMIPFVPIIQANEEPFGMFCDLQQKYSDWVLRVMEYDTVDELINGLEKAVVAPALQMAERLRVRKTAKLQKRHVKDYLVLGT